MIGILEARFYIEDNRTPMTYIKYHENGIEKTLCGPTKKLGEDMHKKVSDFVEGVITEYESGRTTETTEVCYYEESASSATSTSIDDCTVR